MTNPNMQKTMRIIYMGSPLHSTYPLDELLRQGSSHGFEVVAVVSQPAKSLGRKSLLVDPPLAEFAKSKGILTLQPQKASELEFQSQLKNLAPDVIVTCAYGQILNTAFLAIPKRATINIHPSKLPQYRGAIPIQAVLLNGEESTAITILFTVLKLDAGAIISQEVVSIHRGETAQELSERLFKHCGPQLIQALKTIEDPTFVGTPQDETQVTLCKKISKDDGLVRWQSSSREIINKFCAYMPWPGSFTFFQKKRFILESMEANLETPIRHSPGEFYYDKANKFIEVASQDAYVRIVRLKPEGSKSLTAEQFWNGIKNRDKLRFEEIENLPI